MREARNSMQAAAQQLKSMRTGVRSGPLPYVVAAIAVALATLIRHLLDPFLGNDVPFITYFAAIVVAGWCGHLYSGVFAVALSFLAATWFFIPPRYSLTIDTQNPGVSIALITFMLVGLAIAAFSEAVQHGRRLALAHREWLRVTLASIGDAVITCDAQGIISFMNSVAEELTGWTSNEAVGRPLSEVFRIINERTRAAAEDPCQKVLRTGGVVGLANHTVLIAKDGREAPIDDSAAPIREGEGPPIGVVLIFRDASGQRRAHENLERLGAIVEYSADAIIGEKLDGTITSWNTAAERLYGYKADEAIGQPISIIVPPDRRAELDAVMAGIRRGERIEHLETVRLRKDGARIDIALTMSPIKDSYGSVIGASKTARDITQQKRAADSTRVSEERLRLALGAGRMGVWDWDIVSDQITWSPRVYEVFGMQPDSARLCISDFARRVHSDDAERSEQAISRALAGEAPYEIEFRIVRPSGEVRWVSSRGEVVRDGDRAVRMLGVTVDTTDRKLFEENLRFLGDASATMGAVVDLASAMQRLARLCVAYFADWCVFYLLQDDGEIHSVAYAHADLGAEALLEQLTRRGVLEWSGPSLSARVLRSGGAEFVPDVSSGFLDSVSADAGHRAILEQLHPRSVIVAPLEARGRIIGTLAFVRARPGHAYTAGDVEFAQEVARRAGTAIDNCRLYEELKASDRQKDDFLAMLAHELRNPLAAINYATQLSSVSPEQAASATDIIQRQVQQLRRLIDDLLDVSRITRNKIQLQREVIDASVMVNRAAATARPLVEQHAHSLTIELAQAPMPILADPVRVEQIIVNLLTNAAKYTPSGGQILVRAAAEDSQAVIRVKDSGIGIPPEMLSRVFELFTQLDRTLDRSQGGLGIGLTLVRRLVEMHGGSVSATSEGLGKGSEFTVRFPLTNDARLAGTAKPGVSIRPGLRVLIVDDNADTATTLSLLLKKLQCATEQVHSGGGALAAAQSFRPDVVLLDIGLPGIDGYEVARQLRKDRELSVARLIAVSGYGQEQDQQRSKSAGFDYHLVKPVDFAALVALLAEDGQSGVQ